MCWYTESVVESANSHAHTYTQRIEPLSQCSHTEIPTQTQAPTFHPWNVKSACVLNLLYWLCPALAPSSAARHLAGQSLHRVISHRTLFYSITPNTLVVH